MYFTDAYKIVFLYEISLYSVDMIYYSEFNM